MADDNGGIVQTAVETRAVQPDAELVILAGNEAVVDFSEVRPPAADPLDGLAPDGQVCSDRQPFVAERRGVVPRGLVAVVDQREGTPDVARGSRQQLRRRR